ncbi:extracellular solute-binding protein [Oceanibacterium hippocampi]|uniref:Putrescine-binding periplasmic protein n=1 Tax=Oceanibacterium hippocampi TaxID=745714 RepID=A0A1Y5TEX7_9PROT|nr:extracellular solute-binding protein [Oceanibacterium hippocampi]SLN62369.1 Spermidine/putrescine-binding periplasmic protein precursor [Oceanibacterium hippocampi]
MMWKLSAGLAGAALLASAGMAQAAGELNLYNWGNYTNPELIKKFEEAHDIKITVTDYDSNSTALAKVKAGGHGFDMVVPSANFVKIFIDEGLAMESRPDQMPNFKNVAEQWRNPPWDPGRHYSVPWQWGTVGMVVDTSVYDGDINTSAIVFDPPESLVGKINVAPEMGDIMGLALMYVGSEPCTTDKDALKKARDALMAAKPKWLSMDYGLVEKMPRGDFAAAAYWNGAAFRARLAKDTIKFGYPKEGYPVWMDSVLILKDAKNVENAKTFMNFVMEPENAALISAFARYANGIDGSEAFMPEDMKTAVEIQVPDAYKDKGVFLPACPKEVNDIYTAIWTELTK